MKKLLYLTIPSNSYINILMVFLKCINLYADIDHNTEILIITNEKVKNKIKKNIKQLELKIKYFTDDIDSVESNCCSFLNIYDYENIDQYDKILYVNIDILITRNINKIFDLLSDNDPKLYVATEPVYKQNTNYIFENELDQYKYAPIFSSNILLFNNTQESKEIFDEIINNISNCNKLECQAYLNYYCAKYDMFDNMLTKYTSSNPQFYLDNDKFTFCHFSGPNNETKYQKINSYFNKIDGPDEINEIILKARKYIDNNLLPIIKSTGESLEGNVFMKHKTYQYDQKFVNKQKNLIIVSSQTNNKKCLEIGFNAGFSALLMLLSNPNIELTCIDIGEHKYTIPCFNKIKEDFSSRINLIIGDSTKILPVLNGFKYDLIHIDGGHSKNIAEKDILNSFMLSKNGTTFIMDDYSHFWLHDLWDKYVGIFNLQNVFYYIFPSKYHDIKVYLPYYNNNIYKKNNTNNSYEIASIIILVVVIVIILLLLIFALVLFYL